MAAVETGAAHRPAPDATPCSSSRSSPSSPAFAVGSGRGQAHPVTGRDRVEDGAADASLITVPVELRTLTSDVVARGERSLRLATDGHAAGVAAQAGHEHRVDRAR